MGAWDQKLLPLGGSICLTRSYLMAYVIAEAYLPSGTDEHLSPVAEHVEGTTVEGVGDVDAVGSG